VCEENQKCDASGDEGQQKVPDCQVEEHEEKGPNSQIGDHSNGHEEIQSAFQDCEL
jgi:hypothetical protein